MTGVARAMTLAACLMVLGASPVEAQRRVEIPKPVSLTLRAKDGVAIHAKYFPGGVVAANPNNRRIDGKQVAPVILVHELGGRGAQLDRLATALQRQGHAVIVPDLRFHGESAGSDYDTDRLNKKHFATMGLDLAACKAKLLRENNAGKLNIEMLTIVGIELGATIALNYSLYDWSLPQLPTHRQGRDVHGLVLISPERSVKGYNLNLALKAPLLKSDLVSVMILAGARGSAGAEAARIEKSLGAKRADLPEDPKERAERQTLYLIRPDTTLNGTKLLYGSPQVPRYIQEFIKRRFTDIAQRYPWQDRTGPLSDD